MSSRVVAASPPTWRFALAPACAAAAAAVSALAANQLSPAGFALALSGLLLVVLVAVKPILGVVVVCLVRAPAEVFNGDDLLEVAGISFDPPGMINLAFLIGGAVWLLWKLRAGEPVWRMPLLFPMTIFSLMAVASLAYTADLFFSLRDVFKLTAVFAAYVLVVAADPSSSQIRWIFRAIIASSLYPVAVGWWQFVNSIGVNFEQQAGLRVSSVFEHPNTFALYLVALLVTLWGLRDGAKGWALGMIYGWMLFVFVTMMLPMGRTAWMATGIIVLIVGWKHRKLLLAAAAAGIGSMLLMPRTLERILDLFSTSSSAGGDSLTIRLDVWTEAARLWQQKPLTGFGWGTFASLAEALSHNDYIRAGVELGVVGFLSFVALMYGLVRASRRASRGRSDFPLAFYGFAIAFVIGSAITNSIEKTPYQWYFWVLAGCAMVWGRAKDRQNEHRSPPPI